MLKQYVLAKSIDDVFEYIEMYSGDTRLIAGGTDLVLDLESGKVDCSCLIDITEIQALKQLEMVDDYIVIGAAVTHSEAHESELIINRAAVLSQACGKVGSLQIRNIATVVGNVVSGQPAADAAVALMALGASAEIKSSNGTKIIPLEELYAGLGKTKIDRSCEVVTSIKFPALLKNQGSAFERFAKREALALPILNVAVVISLKQDKCVDWARIVMAPVGPKPTRAISAEKLLEGKVISNELVCKVAEMAVHDANPRDSDLRGSADYRKEVLQVIVRRAIESAVSSI